MSVYFYDKAITDRMRQIIRDDRVDIITPEKAFSKSLHKDDDIQMPAVSLYRPSYSLSVLNRSMPGYRQGIYTNDTEGKLYSTQYLPITINYQCDVYTRTRIQNDELVRELLWYFTLYPQLKMTIDYQNYKQSFTFNVFLGDQLTDNSDINEFENRGQYYRTTFEMVVDEAQLFKVNVESYDEVKCTVIAVSPDGGEFT